MRLRTRVSVGVYNAVAFIIFFISFQAQIKLAASAGAPVASKAESIDALYQKAKPEGRVVVYAASSTKTEEVVFPAFEKRFPGIRVNHVNATADKLVARAIAEARGGRIIGDVLSGTLNYVAQLRDQKLLLDISLPEAGAYPQALKGGDWVATDTEYFIAAWNTSRVKKGDEPKTFEDFADPKWANKLSAEPRDFQVLLGLAKYKYHSDDRAIGQQTGILQRPLATGRAADRGTGGCVRDLLCASYSAAAEKRRAVADHDRRRGRPHRRHRDITQGRASSQRRSTLGALAHQ